MRDWSARLARVEAGVAARLNPPKRSRVFLALDPLLADPAWRLAHGLPPESTFRTYESLEAAQASNDGPVVTYYGPAKRPIETEESTP